MVVCAMADFPRPTHQEVCDLIQGITGSYGSIVNELDADFANKITCRTIPKSELSLSLLTALKVHQEISDIYFFAHMLDCDGCCSRTNIFEQFWAQYYEYAEKGCTKKAMNSDWPDGVKAASERLIERRLKYGGTFPKICELRANGLSYEDARIGSGFTVDQDDVG